MVFFPQEFEHQWLLQQWDLAKIPQEEGGETVIRPPDRTRPLNVEGLTPALGSTVYSGSNPGVGGVLVWAGEVSLDQKRFRLFRLEWPIEGEPKMEEVEGTELAIPCRGSDRKIFGAKVCFPENEESSGQTVGFCAVVTRSPGGFLVYAVPWEEGNRAKKVLERELPDFSKHDRFLLTPR